MNGYSDVSTMQRRRGMDSLGMKPMIRAFESVIRTSFQLKKVFNYASNAVSRIYSRRTSVETSELNRLQSFSINLTLPENAIIDETQ